MPKPLEGKTILIATCGHETADRDIKSPLLELGANVMYSEKLLPLRPDFPIIGTFESYIPPVTPANTASYISDLTGVCKQVGDKVEQHEPKDPKIDAIILHNMDIKQEPALIAAIELTKRIKDKCPVIVSDDCDNRVAIQSLQDAGAIHLNHFELSETKLTAAITDIVAQHGKQGRQVGV